MSDLQSRYTAHQVPRGSRPDALVDGEWHLIKNVPVLRLTYQIRLLTALSRDHGTRLVVTLPATATLSEDLKQFVSENSTIEVQRAPR